MIASLSGTVLEAGLSSAVIEVGGVGLLVHAPPGTLADLHVGRAATLFTALVVREDSLTLYGFGDADSRAVFSQVQTVSGIGPKIALALLAVLTPDELRRAVLAGDLAALTSVPGIGAKGAQRLVLELKDRLGAPTGTSDSAAAVASGAAEAPWRAEVAAALVGLGWSAKEADRTVALTDDQFQAEGVADDDVRTAEALRRALRGLDRR